MPLDKWAIIPIRVIYYKVSEKRVIVLALEQQSNLTFESSLVSDISMFSLLLTLILVIAYSRSQKYHRHFTKFSTRSLAVSDFGIFAHNPYSGQTPEGPGD